MTREELVAKIRQHVSMCWQPGAQFGVSEVVELADGVLAVCETDGEHTLYFDKSKCKLPKQCTFEDVGLKIDNFPEGTGFITDVTAQGWGDIRRTAQSSLVPKSRGKEIVWHKKPVKVKY